MKPTAASLDVPTLGDADVDPLDARASADPR